MTTVSDDGILDTIVDLYRACKELEVTPVIIGGIAVSLVAVERNTKDVDAMIVFDTSKTEQILSCFDAYGFSPRFKDMAEFGRQSRFMTFQHKSDVVMDTIDLQRISVSSDASSGPIHAL